MKYFVSWNLWAIGTLYVASSPYSGPFPAFQCFMPPTFQCETLKSWVGPQTRLMGTCVRVCVCIFKRYAALTYSVLVFNNLPASKVQSDALVSPQGMLQSPQLLLFTSKLLSLLLREPAVRVNREIVHFIINDLGTTHTTTKWME